MSAEPTPRVAIGLPSFNGEDHLDAALTSLRAQSYGEFVLACHDDASSDRTVEILERHAAEDPRIVVERAERRVGMIGNWRASFLLARAHCPSMTYYAWASDHDIWHPSWLERLLDQLERHEEAVLAYPFTVGIGDDGTELRRRGGAFSTVGVSGRRRRLAAAVRGMGAGSMVYGLYRADLVERCGIFPAVIAPDRLLLSELALFGEFLQVEERLWSRRYRTGVTVSNARQRRAFFPERTPLWAYLPWPLQHSTVLGWRLAVKGAGRPEVGRVAGAAVAGWYGVRTLGLATYRRARKALHPWRKRWRKRRRRRARALRTAERERRQAERSAKRD